MAYNNYIVSLQDLRRRIEQRIDNEIEDCMRGRGNSERLKESLEYILNDNSALRGHYKDEESRVWDKNLKGDLYLWEEK